MTDTNVRGYPSLLNQDILEKNLGLSFQIQKVKFQSRQQCRQHQDPAHRPTLQTPGAFRSERNVRRLRSQSSKEVHFPKLKHRRNSISRQSSTSRGNSFPFCQTPNHDVRPISALSGVSVSNWRPGSMSSGFVSPERALMKHTTVSEGVMSNRKAAELANKRWTVSLPFSIGDEKEEKRRGSVQRESQSSSSGSGIALNIKPSSNSDNADKDRLTEKSIKEKGIVNKYENFRYPFYSGFRYHEARFKQQLSGEPTPRYNFETYDRDELDKIHEVANNQREVFNNQREVANDQREVANDQREVANNQQEVDNGNQTFVQSQSQMSNDLDTSRRSQPDVSNDYLYQSPRLWPFADINKTVVAKVDTGAVKRTPKKDKRDEIKKPKEPPKYWHQRNELLPDYAQEGCTLYCIQKDGNENNVTLQHVIETLNNASKRSELEGPLQPPNMSKATEESTPLVDSDIHHRNMETYDTETVNHSKDLKAQIDSSAVNPSGRMSKNDRSSINTPNSRMSQHNRDNDVNTPDYRTSRNDRDSGYVLRQRMLQSNRDTNNLSPTTPQQQRLAKAFSSSINPDHQAYLSESSGKSSPRTVCSEISICPSMIHSVDIATEPASSSCSLVSHTSQPTIDKDTSSSTTKQMQEIRSSNKCSPINCEEKSVCDKTLNNEDDVDISESSLSSTKCYLAPNDTRLDPTTTRNDHHEEQHMSQQAISQQAMSEPDMSQPDMSQQDISQQDISQQDIAQQYMSQQAMSPQQQYKSIASNDEPGDDKSYFRNSTTEEEYPFTQFNFETHTLKNRERKRNRKLSTKVKKQELRPAVNNIDDQIVLKGDLDGIIDEHHATIDTVQGENVNMLASTLNKCPGSWLRSLHKMQVNLDSGVASTNTAHNIIESLKMLKMKKDAACFSEGSGMCVQGHGMVVGYKYPGGNNSNTVYDEMANSPYHSDNSRCSTRMQYGRCHGDEETQQKAVLPVLCGQCKHEMMGQTDMSGDKQVVDVEGKNINVNKEVCKTKCIHGKTNNCKICKKVFGWIERNESIWGLPNSFYDMY